MLIQRHPHTPFHGHHHSGDRHGMHDPMVLKSLVEMAFEEALAASVDNSQPRRGPTPLSLLR
jgi:hypothetical protein